MYCLKKEKKVERFERCPDERIAAIYINGRNEVNVKYFNKYTSKTSIVSFWMEDYIIPTSARKSLWNI